MATAKKSAKKRAPTKRGGAAKKSVKKTATAKKSPLAKKKAALRKPAPAHKQPAKKRLVAKKAAASSKKTVASKQATRNPIVAKSAAKPASTPVALKKPAPVAKSSAPKKEPMSAEAKQKQINEKMWALVEEKKRQAAQTPAWQAIQHHDHPSPQGAGGNVPQPSDAALVDDVPGRDRGTD